MAKEQYFMLSRCEDELGFGVLTKEELLKHFEEGGDGPDTNYIQNAKDVEGGVGGYFPGHSVLIIKGKVVVPKPVEVVKKLEIE